MIGSRTGKSPTVDSVVTPMVPSISVTSVDVPPMSNPMMRGYPAATATACAPTAPAAGPDRIVCTAACFARAAEIDPPFDCMMLRSHAGTARPSPRRQPLRCHGVCARQRQPAAPASCLERHHRAPASLLQPLFQRGEIPRHQRRDIGVDDRGAEAFVFAVFRQHAMRGGHGEAGALEVRGDRFLVRRIDVGVQQAHRDGVDIPLAARGDHRRNRRFVERLEHRPIGGQALADAERQRGIDERTPILDHEVVQLAASLTPDPQHVLEARRRHQRDARALPFEHRVRRDRRSMDDVRARQIAARDQLRHAGHDRA